MENTSEANVVAFVPFTEMTLEELTNMTQEQLEAHAITCRVSVDEIHARMTELAGVSTEEVATPEAVAEVSTQPEAQQPAEVVAEVVAEASQPATNEATLEPVANIAETVENNVAPATDPVVA